MAKSKYDDYQDEIIGLFLEDRSAKYVADYLNEKYNLDVTTSSVRNLKARWADQLNNESGEIEANSKEDISSVATDSSHEDTPPLPESEGEDQSLTNSLPLKLPVKKLNTDKEQKLPPDIELLVQNNNLLLSMIKGSQEDRKDFKELLINSTKLLSEVNVVKQQYDSAIDVFSNLNDELYESLQHVNESKRRLLRPLLWGLVVIGCFLVVTVLALFAGYYISRCWDRTAFHYLLCLAGIPGGIALGIAFTLIIGSIYKNKVKKTKQEIDNETRS